MITLTGFKKSCKIIAVALAAIFLAGGVITGVAAYLSSRTEQVNNTLTVGDVSISIAETNEKMLPLIPGSTISKDPKITVKSGSADCYLYVKVRESDNLKTYISYKLASGWKPLGDEYPNVYYREVDSMNVDIIFSILEGDKVKAIDVDDATLASLTAETLPKLAFVGFAVQKKDVDNATAGWGALKARYQRATS